MKATLIRNTEEMIKMKLTLVRNTKEIVKMKGTLIRNSKAEDNPGQVQISVPQPAVSAEEDAHPASDSLRC